MPFLLMAAGAVLGIGGIIASRRKAATPVPVVMPASDASQQQVPTPGGYSTSTPSAYSTPNPTGYPYAQGDTMYASAPIAAPAASTAPQSAVAAAAAPDYTPQQQANIAANPGFIGTTIQSSPYSVSPADVPASSTFYSDPSPYGLQWNPATAHYEPMTLAQANAATQPGYVAPSGAPNFHVDPQGRGYVPNAGYTPPHGAYPVNVPTLPAH